MEEAKEIIEIIILALAIWRTACIITGEEFVFGLAQKLRTKLGVKQEPVVIEWNNGVTFESDEDDNEFPVFQVKQAVKWMDLDSELQPTAFTRGLTCVWCVSWWLGVLFTVAYLLVPDILFVASLPFALSSFAIAFNGLVDS